MSKLDFVFIDLRGTDSKTKPKKLRYDFTAFYDEEVGRDRIREQEYVEEFCKEEEWEFD